MAEPRQGLGSFFRAILGYIDERGLRDELRGQVSSETRALIDAPPRPLSFISSRPIDEIEAAVQRIAGPDACVECGLAAARPLGWSLLQPVLRVCFAMFGQSPGSIFENLDRFFSLVTRGISFQFEAGTKGGEVRARFEGADVPEAAFHVLRGTLLFALEVSGTRGEVEPHVVVESQPSVTVVRYRVRWS